MHDINITSFIKIIWIAMIKQFFSFILSAALFFASINYAEATIDDLVNNAKPDRAKSWTLLDQPNIQLNEYYISALDLACGFKAFGYNSRNDALDIMLSALADIDEQYEDRNNKLRTYIENEYNGNVENYLRSLKNIQYELTYTPNRFYNTNDFNEFPEELTYSLINAFALLNNKNLCIYEEVKNENEDKIISLTHSFSLDHANETLHLLCRGLHYNKLVFAWEEEENTKALTAENNYLNELRLFYECESSIQITQPSFNNALKLYETPDNQKLDPSDPCYTELQTQMNMMLSSDALMPINNGNDFFVNNYINNEGFRQTEVIPSYSDTISNSLTSVFDNGLPNGYFDTPQTEEYNDKNYLNLIQEDIPFLSCSVMNIADNERNISNNPSNNIVNSSKNMVDENPSNNNFNIIDDYYESKMALDDGFYYNENDFN